MSQEKPEDGENIDSIDKIRNHISEKFLDLMQKFGSDPRTMHSCHIKLLEAIIVFFDEKQVLSRLDLSEINRHLIVIEEDLEKRITM